MGEVDQLFQQSSFILYATIFLGGLALNLTPCVYPLIPVTLSYFTDAKHNDPLHRMMGAVLYLFGMAITYSVLGTLAAISGGFFGEALQSDWVRLGLASVFFLMALSEFGLFRLPSSFGQVHVKKGKFGAFLLGLTMGFVAAPCIGPFVVSLLSFVAAQADPFLGMRLFLVLSLGLGFPYLILGYFANGIQLLPRSGHWLVWVHRGFGVLLLALAFSYASPTVSGWMEDAGWVQKEEKVITDFKNFSLKAFNEARGTRPIVIDVAAEWCAPCKELEEKTFANSRVREAFQGFELLYLDVTDTNPPAIEDFVSEQEVVGVPTVLFYDANGERRDDIRLENFEPPEDFLKRLEKVNR